jgi:hypothetical protein
VIAWRTPIVRQAENTDTARDDIRPRTLSGAIMLLFREVKLALTCKAPEPRKKPKRRSGESQGGFRFAFKQLVSRVERSTHHFNSFYHEPPDEIDESQRLHLWHQNNEEGEWHGNEAFHQEPQDHLSLHL